MIGDWTPATVAARVKARPERFSWLLAQADGETTPTQREAIRDACHAQGIRCGVWEAQVDFGTPARSAMGMDCYVGQIEGPNQYDRMLASLAAFRAAHPDMPAAVVTNFGGLETAEKARPFIDAGFYCITESHVREDPNSTIERKMDYASRVLKWPAPQPMIGLGMGATLADYPGWENYEGASVFAAEQLL